MQYTLSVGISFQSELFVPCDHLRSLLPECSSSFVSKSEKNVSCPQLCGRFGGKLRSAQLHAQCSVVSERRVDCSLMHGLSTTLLVFLNSSLKILMLLKHRETNSMIHRGHFWLSQSPSYAVRAAYNAWTSTFRRICACVPEAYSAACASESPFVGIFTSREERRPTFTEGFQLSRRDV